MEENKARIIRIIDAYIDWLQAARVHVSENKYHLAGPTVHGMIRSMSCLSLALHACWRWKVGQSPNAQEQMALDMEEMERTEQAFNQDLKDRGL